MVDSINESKISPVSGKIQAIFELEDPLNTSPGGGAGGIMLVNFSVVGGITIVHFSSDVGKISAILLAGGPAGYHPWWRGRRHIASKFFCGGWHNDNKYFS
jgi:hypothetical protein